MKSGNILWAAAGKKNKEMNCDEKSVNSLSKDELQERLYNALVELENIRNNYW